MIMALVIFILVRLMKRLTEPLVKSDPGSGGAHHLQTCPYCLTEIPIGATLSACTCWRGNITKRVTHPPFGGSRFYWGVTLRLKISKF